MPTYHVDYLNGSNTTGNGTAAAPWATVLYACQTGPVAANDTIKVAATGAELTIDSAASITGLTTIGTSTDLTGQLVVGDLFVMSPNIPGYPEYDGWMIFEVGSITSTTITVANANRFTEVFPNYASLVVTIKKFTNFVNAGASGNFDVLNTISIGNLTGVTIEGGYDATFTSVVGTTNIFRPANVTSSTGDVLSHNATSGINYFVVKNFRFSKFARALNTTTNGSCGFDNVWFHSLSTNFGNGAIRAGVPGGTATAYFCNSQAEMQSWDNTSTLNVYNLTQTRQLNIQSCNDLISLTTLTNSNITYMNSSTGNNAHIAFKGTISGNVTMNVTDYSTFKVFLFELVAGGPMYYFTPTSFKLMKASSASVLAFASPDSYTARNLVVKLPTGMTIEDLPKPTGLNSGGNGTYTLYYFSDYSIVDGTTTWTVNAGNQVQQTTDTTQFVTGNSSKKIKLTYNTSASALSSDIPLAKFKYDNAGQILQSITIKAKKSSNIAGIEIGGFTTNSPNINLTAGQTINTNTFTDYTFNVTNTSLATDLPTMERLLYIQFTHLNRNTDPDNVYLWIDSVTFNYA